MRTKIETQKIDARLDSIQASHLNRLGKHLVATSDFAPLYLGRRMRETIGAITTSCRLGLERVAAAASGMHPSMSSKPRLGWLVTQPLRLCHSVG
jgi:hypothetical protein